MKPMFLNQPRNSTSDWKLLQMWLVRTSEFHTWLGGRHKSRFWWIHISTKKRPAPLMLWSAQTHNIIKYYEPQILKQKVVTLGADALLHLQVISALKYLCVYSILSVLWARRYVGTEGDYIYHIFSRNWAFLSHVLMTLQACLHQAAVDAVYSKEKGRNVIHILKNNNWNPLWVTLSAGLNTFKKWVLKFQISASPLTSDPPQLPAVSDGSREGTLSSLTFGSERSSMLIPASPENTITAVWAGVGSDGAQTVVWPSGVRCPPTSLSFLTNVPELVMAVRSRFGSAAGAAECFHVTLKHKHNNGTKDWNQ